MVFDPSPLLTNIFTILLGLIVGSFLNVVIIRLPRGESLIRPPSHCPSCDSRIGWRDNIPVLSYLLLRGKCRVCGTAISIRYPVVELLTALVFLAAKVRFGWSPVLFIRDFPFLAALVAITFIDLEHRIIPDYLSLGGLVWGLATSLLFSFWQLPGSEGVPHWLGSLAGAAVGFGLFYGLAWAYEKFARRSGLGGGDIKFLAMLGAFLGVQGVFTTVLVSSIFGSFAGLLWGWASRRNQASGSSDGILKVSIPYGPFLVVGGLYHYLLGDLAWLPFMRPM